MPRIPQLRIIVETEPNAGDWNMAVDESLLNTAISLNVATLRWYRWREPTVSLGYFQKSKELSEDPVLSHLPAVRRITGGGAILHDDEWTYSVALPSSQSLFCQPEALYDLVHRGLTRGLQEMGFAVGCRGETLKRPDEPLLCFHRKDAHDITLNGYKIVGSAQRRRRGAILQHGSVIRRASKWAKQLPGLADLSENLLPEDMAERLSNHIAQVLADSRATSTLTTLEIEAASRICQQVSVNLR